MLSLYPVSKCKKLVSIKNRNRATSFAFNNLTENPTLYQQLPPPSPPSPADHSITFHANYSKRDFEDANYTKHISQQILILRTLMLIIGVLSITLCRVKAIWP